MLRRVEKQSFNSISLVFVLLFEVLCFLLFFVVIVVVLFVCLFEAGFLCVASVPGLA